MSLSGLLTSVAEFVAQVIVDDCGRQSPDRVLRYFGGGVPQDCCTEVGVLSVSWDRGDPTESFPVSSASKQNACTSRPMYSLSIHYDVCWSAPKADATGIELLDDAWDADAAMLADVADCVARALIRLGCCDYKFENEVGEKAQAVIDELARGCDDWRYREVVPIGPGGSCARLTWRAYAAPTAGDPPS